jgi:hypothetical protein
MYPTSSQSRGTLKVQERIDSNSAEPLYTKIVFQKQDPPILPERVP